MHRSGALLVFALLSSNALLGVAWGGDLVAVKYAPMATNIKEKRSASSRSVGVAEGGDALRVGLLRKNWYAAFPADAEHPDKQDVVGYVYAPLLKDSAPAE